MSQSMVSAFFMVVLQVLWVFRLIYDGIFSTNSRTPEQPPTPHTQLLPLKKLHQIQLYYTPKNRSTTGRPLCYLHICEVVSPLHGEILRCICARGTTPKHHISKQTLSTLAA